MQAYQDVERVYAAGLRFLNQLAQAVRLEHEKANGRDRHLHGLAQHLIRYTLPGAETLRSRREKFRADARTVNCGGFIGAAGGDRTHDIQNHNLALLPTELQPPQHHRV